MGVSAKANESPFAKAFTNVTVVFASGLNAVFIVSSHAKAVGAGGGAGAGAGAASSLPPHAACNAQAATAEQRKDRRDPLGRADDLVLNMRVS